MTTTETEPQVNPKPTIGRASVEAQDLAKYLATAEIGDVMTYQQLNEAAKCDVQERNTVLCTARKIVMRERRYVFGTIIGVGVKRLSDDEIPEEGISAIKRSRRIARNGMRKMECADLTRMSPEARVRVITTKTVLGLFTASGSRKVMHLAEQGARNDSDTLKIGDITSLFKK